MTLTGPAPDTEDAEAGAGFTSDEMMTVAASRALRDGVVCFVGIGLPSTAANLARTTHAPNLVLVYESGAIGAKPSRLPLSIGDAELAETADTVVSVPEIFNYWLQPGRIDVGFLSAAQLDRHANLNSTVIGPYDAPSVRLPGAGGAPEIAGACGEVIIIIRQFAPHLCRKTRFRHLGWLPRRPGGPRAARPERERAHAGHNRPRAAQASAGRPRAGADPFAPGRGAWNRPGRPPGGNWPSPTNWPARSPRSPRNWTC